MSTPWLGARVALLTAFVVGCAFHPQGGAESDDDAGVDTDAVAESDTDAADHPTDAPLVGCPSGYAPIDGSATRYRVVEVNAAWSAAASDCNDDDDELAKGEGRTHLLVVGSAGEKAALTDRFSGNTWVGLTDLASEGVFTWVTAEPTAGFPVVGQEPPWDAGDPDGGTNENCVRFKNSFDFEDKPCTDGNSYVCECDRFAPL